MCGSEKYIVKICANDFFGFLRDMRFVMEGSVWDLDGHKSCSGVFDERDRGMKFEA